MTLEPAAEAEALEPFERRLVEDPGRPVVLERGVPDVGVQDTHAPAGEAEGGAEGRGAAARDEDRGRRRVRHRESGVEGVGHRARVRGSASGPCGRAAGSYDSGMSVQVHDAIVLGLGQLGGVFAHGLLRAGRSVHPCLRGTDRAALAGRVDPAIVCLTVGEDDLPEAVRGLPAAWGARALLVQNELLPDVWRAAGLVRPTVAVVWFEKKRGTGITPILPTPVAGPAADVALEALAALDVPAERVDEGAPLAQALVAKNLYVVAANVAGLAGLGDTVGDLAGSSGFRRIGDEVLSIQEARLGAPLDRAAVWAVIDRAIEADPGHGARGRSAPRRLARALRDAASRGVAVPELRAVARAAGVEPAGG